MQVTVSIPTKGLDIRYLPQLGKVQFKLDQTKGRALLKSLLRALLMNAKRKDLNLEP